MKNLLLTSVLATLAATASAVTVDDLQKRVEALEYQGYENTLSWSGFFETRFDELKVEPTGKDKFTLHLSRNLAVLDFKAKPLANLTIFGRLSYTNVFNNQTAASGNVGGRNYNTSLASFERLFINYVLVDGLSFSVGRLPTVDGPPTQVYDGLSRQGSYPRQIYSSSLDGYALTYKIPTGSDAHALDARLVYTPLSHIDYQGGPGISNVFGRDEIEARGPTGVATATGNYYESTIPLTSWMLDYTWSGSSIAQSITAIYQGFQFKNFQLAPGWRFEYTNHDLYLELNNIASLGVTVYESYATTNIKNKGGVNAGPAGQWSLGANELNGKVSGKASITGIVYTLPVSALKNPLIGYEAYKADKGSMQFDFAGKDPMGFYVQRGTGTHVYYTQPINSNMKLRLGMMQTEADYTPGVPLTGAPKPSEDKSKSLYANLRVDF